MNDDCEILKKEGLRMNHPDTLSRPLDVAITDVSKDSLDYIWDTGSFMVKRPLRVLNKLSLQLSDSHKHKCFDT